MDRAYVEVVVETEEAVDVDTGMQELSALQLVLVGGGVGEVVFH